jgi:hypothetical protein
MTKLKVLVLCFSYFTYNQPYYFIKCLTLKITLNYKLYVIWDEYHYMSNVSTYHWFIHFIKLA